MQNCGLIRSLYQCHSTINSHKISVHELRYQCPWPSVDWQITRATRGSELVKLNLSPCVSRKLVVHGTSTLLYATADSWWVYFIELRWGTCHNIARTLHQGPAYPQPHPAHSRENNGQQGVGWSPAPLLRQASSGTQADWHVLPVMWWDARWWYMNEALCEILQCCTWEIQTGS